MTDKEGWRKALRAYNTVKPIIEAVKPAIEAWRNINKVKRGETHVSPRQR